MRIKVGNSFLDFEDMIEMERQVKLFEDIETTDGDFSYSFSIPKTINNTSILNNPMPDNIQKDVYQKIGAKIVSEDGENTYDGYLRIERISQEYECSFFSGNNNWFSLLTGHLNDLDWSEFDTELTEANIAAAIDRNYGLVFPLVDNGLLNTRGYPLMKVEDFIAGIYVKTVFEKIFNHHGIKLEGELFADANYQSAVTLQNRKNEEKIAEHSVYAFTNNAPIPADNVFHLMEWTDDFNAPYTDPSNHLSLVDHRITTTVRMRIEIEVIINTPVAPIFFFMMFVRNGAPPSTPGDWQTDVVAATDAGISLKAEVEIDVGDYVEVWIDSQSGHGNPLVITDATLRVTPLFIYEAFGDTVVPDWTQQEYVSNILRLFNCITFYDNTTLTVNLFEKIKHRAPIDLSPYISAVEVDYTEFIGSYARRNLLSYQEFEDNNITEVRIPFESGVVISENEHLEEEKEIIASDFTQPITYLNAPFKMSMSRTDFLEFEQDTQFDVSSVQDDSGIAGFNILDIHLTAEVGDMVRFSDMTNKVYNGDWEISDIFTNRIHVTGAHFSSDATGKAAKMIFNYTTSDKVYILHHVPGYSTPNFAQLEAVTIESTPYVNMAYSFFDIIDTGLQVSDDFPFSLAFGDYDQIGLSNQYFRLFEQVLNDPVKLICVAHLPYWLFKQLDFLSPVKILTEETTNVYYLNRITGYKEPYLPCELELIKI